MEQNWKINKGIIPILFVAQHNFSQIRNIKIKAKDMLTGEIVENLAKKLNGFSMITTKIQLDPNWYKDSDFRKEVFKIIKNNNIKLVVDIHGRKLE